MNDLMAVIHGLFENIVHGKDQLTINQGIDDLL